MSDQRHHLSWLVPILAWATILLFSAVAAPVPGVNEPHYLCKARHFWQPDWCSQDFFLASPNAHTVFYATIGSLTRIASFEQSAWIGRILAMFVLAWGWTHCLSRGVFDQWSTLWCAWIFLALAACGNFSGEWLVGGVEGKVFAYGFLFRGIRRRTSPPLAFYAAVWFGIGVISFHPVVGIWGLLAFAGNGTCLQWADQRMAKGAAHGRYTSSTDRCRQDPSGFHRCRLVGWLLSPFAVVPDFIRPRVAGDDSRSSSFDGTRFGRDEISGNLHSSLFPARSSSRSHGDSRTCVLRLCGPAGDLAE